MIDRGSGTNTLVAGDVIRLQPIEGNQSSDDDFRLQNSSPAIDAGDPSSYYLSEPSPNGGRTNLGGLGNTSASTRSSAQTLQVLLPSGFEKLKAGQIVPVGIRGTGLSQTDTTALINSGGSTVDAWLGDRYRSNGSTSTIGTAVNLLSLASAAPAAVYQSFSRAPSGVGQSLNYQLPVPDGSYQIRLHFVEPSLTTVGSRRFNIQLQGATVQSNFDVLAAAGGVRTATARTFNVTASGGTGINLTLLNLTTNEAVLSALELTTANVLAPISPTVKVELSTDNEATWTTIANNVPLDRFGDATWNWTVPSLSTGTIQARIRVTSNDAPTIFGQSPNTFSIAGSGRAFYVNDGSITGDEFTTAIGDDANLGTSPDSPMSTLSALIAAYQPSAGDIIYVDVGNYDLDKNIVLTAQNSGLRIQGPNNGSALLNRANTSSGSYAIELINADNLTLDRISITGGYNGLFAAANSDSDNLTFSNSKVYDNYFAGIYLEATNDGAKLLGNELFGTLGGITTNDQFQGNIYVFGSAAEIRENNSYYVGTGGSGARIGIYANSSSSAPSTISGNTVSNAAKGLKQTMRQSLTTR